MANRYVGILFCNIKMHIIIKKIVSTYKMLEAVNNLDILLIFCIV